MVEIEDCMKRKVYHVTRSDDGDWKGRLVGAARASVSADTKAEAVARTVELARESKPAQVADPRRFPG
jgi:hypothetical protein